MLNSPNELNTYGLTQKLFACHEYENNSRPSEKWFFFACCLTYQIQIVPDKNGFCLFQTKIVFVLWSSTLYNLLTNLCPFPNNLDISGGFICKMNRFLYVGCNKRTSFAYKTAFTYPLVLYLYCFIKWSIYEIERYFTELFHLSTQGRMFIIDGHLTSAWKFPVVWRCSLCLLISDKWLTCHMKLTFCGFHVFVLVLVPKSVSDFSYL